MAYNLGWIPTTDHLAAHPVWEYQIKGGTQPPQGKDYLIIKVDGEARSHVELTDGSPPGFNGGGEPVTGAFLCWVKDGVEVACLPWQ
jgi:hypothetical protein